MEAVSALSASPTTSDYSQWGFFAPVPPFPPSFTPAVTRISKRKGFNALDLRSRKHSQEAPDPQRFFQEALNHHLAGRLDDALTSYRNALFLSPDYVDAHNNLGVALLAKGRPGDAIVHYRRALLLDPDHRNASNNLGTALVAQGQAAEAIPHYEKALARNPRDPNVYYNLGIALTANGRIEDALTCYQNAIALNPGYVEAHNNLGNLLAAQSRLDEATLHYGHALAINPRHAIAHNNLAGIFRDQGKFDAALAHYELAIALHPDSAEAHYNRSEMKVFRPGDPDLAALETLAAQSEARGDKSPYIHFAMAKALEDTGDYARSFTHLQLGNDLKRRQISYDEARVSDFFQSIASAFDRDLFHRLQDQGDPSKVPVFVVGMPRSGSSLIEQILASHPQIHGAGELEDLEKSIAAVLQTELQTGGPSARFPECIATSLTAPNLKRMGETYLSRLAHLPAPVSGEARIVNKLPVNFLRIGLIRLIFPNARIIHTTRDPIDTCVSCYSKLFTSGQHFTYNQGELGRYYRLYENLMAHWQAVLPSDAMLHVAYEDVIDDLEGQSRRLIEYCGLPWDARCLSFHSTTRLVKTASAVQVRKPVFRSSLQRWRKYEGQIGPLLEALQGASRKARAVNPAAQ